MGKACKKDSPYFQIFFLQYHYSLSFILILEILGVIFIVTFYFREESIADLGIYPEEYFEDAIIKYRDDSDMQNFIDNMQDVVSKIDLFCFAFNYQCF